MTTYVALLRGINVGGNNKVDMKILKSCMEEMGLINVRTYINSGNVIFNSDKDEQSLTSLIERCLENKFGWKIGIVVRNQKNIENVCKNIPKEWINSDGQKTDVIFLYWGYDTKKSLELITFRSVDNIRYIDRAIVWNIARGDYSKSGMNKFVGTNVYKNMTARNVNTVRKLMELMNGNK
jgi:uncharacterized protein (DUF1697 family)